MTRRAYHLTFALFAVVAVASLMTAAYWYGKSGAAVQAGNAPQGAAAKILLGKITRTEPLHLYVENETLGPSRVYDVLISPQTKFLQLVPWAPGEKEAAEKQRRAYLERLRPGAGDPVPPPTPPYKPEALDPRALVPGITIGVLAIQSVVPDQAIIAAAIRPLTPDEAGAAQVAATFPL